MMKKKREDEYYNQKLNIQKKPPVETVRSSPLPALSSHTLATASEEELEVLRARRVQRQPMERHGEDASGAKVEVVGDDGMFDKELQAPGRHSDRGEGRRGAHQTRPAAHGAGDDRPSGQDRAGEL
eukprot:749773-Hanusia_phi.AAC.4